jgi:hypothetical protein
MPEFSMSKHACTRANQRGITHQMISDLIAFADVERPAGDGCTVLRVSRRGLEDRDLRKQLACNPDKLASLALVWNGESCEVVTVLVDHGGAKGRRYRRAH